MKKGGFADTACSRIFDKTTRGHGRCGDERRACCTMSVLLGQDEFARTARTFSFVDSSRSSKVEPQSPLSSFHFMSSQLPNYLRSNRKRLGFSQEEIAFLLGAVNGAKICRYERFVREPSLESAIACEIIYQRPIRQLFPGRYRKRKDAVVERAKVLRHRLARVQNEQSLQKCRALALIIDGHSKAEKA